MLSSSLMGWQQDCGGEGASSCCQTPLCLSHSAALQCLSAHAQTDQGRVSVSLRRQKTMKTRCLPLAPRWMGCSGPTRAKVSFKHQGHGTLAQPSLANTSVFNERHRYAIIPPPSGQHHNCCYQSLRSGLYLPLSYTLQCEVWPLAFSALWCQISALWVILYGVTKTCANNNFQRPVD